MKTIIHFCFLALATISYPAGALEQSHPQKRITNLPDRDKDSKFSYNGYISQGWSLSRPEHFNVSGQSSNRAGSLARTEIGAYGSYIVSPNVDLRGGLKYDPTGTFDRKPHVVFGLLDLHDSSSSYGVRFGRVRNFFGFQSSTRENPATRILDYPPQSIYRESFKTVSSSGDGIQLYVTSESSVGLLKAELTLAAPILKPQRELVEGFFGYPAQGNYTTRTEAALRTFNLQWASKDFTWAAHYTISRLNLNYLPAAIDLVEGASSMDLTLHTVGLRRYLGDVRVTGEVLYVAPSGKVWDVLDQDPSAEKFQSLGAALEVAVYKGNWVYAAGYNVWYNNIYDRKGNGLGHSLGLPAHRFYSHDINLGVQYTNDAWVWRAEVHRVQGTSTLPVTSNPSLPAERRQYMFVSTSITYKF